MSGSKRTALLSTTALAGLIGAAAMLAAPTPAYADCTPDPANDGDTVTCAGTDADGFISTIDNATINIEVGAVVIADNADDVGIEARYYNSITNDGLIDIQVGAQGYGTGIVIGSGNSVINNGIISGGHDDGYWAYGIVATGSYNNTVTNNGTIDVWNDSVAAWEGSRAWGISLLVGSNVINNGTISASAIGLDATALGIAGMNITNNGLVTVTSNNSATGLSFYASYDPDTSTRDGSLVNTGTVYVEASGPTGVYASGNTAPNLVTNSGLIDVRSDLIGSGVGVYLSITGNTPYVFENSGDIRVTQLDGVTASGFGVYMYQTTFINSGSVFATTAVFGKSGLVYDEQKVINSGFITGNIDLGDGNDYLSNTNTITGDILFGTGQAIIDNAGLIDGDVTTGDSKDVFRDMGGTVSGTIDLGGGTDFFMVALGAPLVAPGNLVFASEDVIGVTVIDQQTITPVVADGYSAAAIEAFGEAAQVTISSVDPIAAPLHLFGEGKFFNTATFDGSAGTERIVLRTSGDLDVYALVPSPFGDSIYFENLEGGDIGGNIRASGIGDVTIINRGLITGDIHLSYGNNLVLNYGHIDGTFYRTGGTNTLLLSLDGAGGTVADLTMNAIDRFGYFTESVAAFDLRQSISPVILAFGAFGANAQLTLNTSDLFFIDGITLLGGGEIVNTGQLELSGFNEPDAYTNPGIFVGDDHTIFRNTGQIEGSGSNQSAVYLNGYNNTFINDGDLIFSDNSPAGNAISAVGVSSVTVINNGSITGDGGYHLYSYSIDLQVGSRQTSTIGDHLLNGLAREIRFENHGEIILPNAGGIDFGKTGGVDAYFDNTGLLDFKSFSVEFWRDYSNFTFTNSGEMGAVNVITDTGIDSILYAALAPGMTAPDLIATGLFDPKTISITNQSGGLITGKIWFSYGDYRNEFPDFLFGYGIELSMALEITNEAGARIETTGDDGVRIDIRHIPDNLLRDGTPDGVLTASISNAGAISTTGADKFAIKIDSTALQIVSIENTGEIYGQWGAILASGEGIEQVNNSGLIDGAISLGGGDDTLQNSGTIIGDVNGGDGFDTLIIEEGGSLTGSVISFESISNFGSLDILGLFGNQPLAGDLSLESSSIISTKISTNAPVPFRILGTTNLDGSISVEFLLSQGTEILPGDIFEILSSDGGITGTFSSLDFSSNKFFDGTLIYTANGVSVRLDRSSFMLPFFGSGRRAIARQLDGMAGMSATGIAGDFIRSLTFTDRALGGFVMDQLASQAAADLPTPVIEARHGLLSHVSDRLVALSDYRGLEGRWVTSVTGFGEFGDTSGTKYATGGAMAVSAYGVSDQLTVGFAMAGTASDLNIATQYGDNGHKALDLVGFASYRTGALNLSAMLGGSYDEADTERAVLAEGFEGRASGRMQGAGYSAALDAQYNLSFAGVEITPRASFRVASFHHGSYEEREMGNLGLMVEGRTITSLRSSAGINLKRTFGNTDGFRLTPEIGAYYEREFGDRERTANAAFIANPTGSFPIFGEDIDKHRTRLMAGFTAQLNDTVALGVHYEAALGARYDSHRITGGLRVAW